VFAAHAHVLGLGSLEPLDPPEDIVIFPVSWNEATHWQFGGLQDPESIGREGSHYISLSDRFQFS
jgi:hypothetical protein